MSSPQRDGSDALRVYEQINGLLAAFASIAFEKNVAI